MNLFQFLPGKPSRPFQAILLFRNYNLSTDPFGPNTY